MTALPEHKLPCGCRASRHPGLWIIEASAFLCRELHHQGDQILDVEPGGFDDPLTSWMEGDS